MTYNIHPIFVHFPIALLSAYSVLRLLPLSRWFPSVAWKQIRPAFLFLGVIGAAVALSTGEMAEDFAVGNQALVEMHAAFANAASWIYGVLLAGEVVAFLRSKGLVPSFLDRLAQFIERILTQPFFSGMLALVGLVVLSIAGLLGGVLVYGVTADPIAPFILTVLGL